jgi:hypothetical protein
VHGWKYVVRCVFMHCVDFSTTLQEAMNQYDMLGLQTMCAAVQSHQHKLSVLDKLKSVC